MEGCFDTLYFLPSPLLFNKILITQNKYSSSPRRMLKFLNRDRDRDRDSLSTVMRLRING
jgi:hypothetical protein